RGDVVERQRPLVLVDGLVRDLPSKDLREHVLIVVGQRRVDGHQAFLAAFSARPDVPSRRSSSASTRSSAMSFLASSTSKWNRTSAASPTSSSSSPANAAT